MPILWLQFDMFTTSCLCHLLNVSHVMCIKYETDTVIHFLSLSNVVVSHYQVDCNYEVRQGTVAERDSVYNCMLYFAMPVLCIVLSKLCCM